MPLGSNCNVILTVTLSGENAILGLPDRSKLTNGCWLYIAFE